ncbi:glycosyltransferase family 4 protein [Thermocoleostomius sinensis]|uniref:Glycosyltransferase family 4 protein n=1 Tax=Thermocoleostomius sinensis A174 TaxID=2016057 RepID=A0A9E8ZJA5_9CYAN|nr:glycosyltransferase family 4 protein [Thermocoleostomius sinensis]WAL62759.1 glycosyltransferase family 4 protein [Thermocoleostomius sinensis A174]
MIQVFDKQIDLKVYRFLIRRDQHSKSQDLLRRRILKSYELWREVRKAQSEGRKILFQGISPALFAYPVVKPNSSFIVTDWTRKLYEPIWNFLPSPPWLTWIHKKVLNKQKSIIGLTDAVVEEIAKDYSVPKNKLRKGRLPFSFDLDIFEPSPDRQDQQIRILFVGGDMYRKGGDVLLQWFLEQNNPNLHLTLVTKTLAVDHPKVDIKTDINFGQSAHRQLFKSHDIFVLPTKCDAYPIVLGEAACAGLAILTTKNALGAPEVIRNGVNGYISNSQTELLQQLSELVQNKPLIESMKRNSRQFMEQEFSSQLVTDEFIQYIF